MWWISFTNIIEIRKALSKKWQAYQKNSFFSILYIVPHWIEQQKDNTVINISKESRKLELKIQNDKTKEFHFISSGCFKLINTNFNMFWLFVWYQISDLLMGGKCFKEI